MEQIERFPARVLEVEETTSEFYLLRYTRDVIKTGGFRMWDAGPARGCPVLDRMYRRTGLRVFRKCGSTNKAPDASAETEIC